MGNRRFRPLLATLSAMLILTAIGITSSAQIAEGAAGNGNSGSVGGNNSGTVGDNNKGSIGDKDSGAVGKRAEGASEVKYDLDCRHFSAVDGLLSNTVSCIVQTSDGYLWIGTQNGLNRYDGYEFVGFTADDSCNMRIVHVDKQGEYRLNIYTSDGKRRVFDTRKNKFLPGFVNEEPPQKGSVVAQTAIGTYKNTAKGELTLYRKDGTLRQWTLLPLALVDYTRNEHFNVAAIDSTHDVISTYGSGLYIYDVNDDRLTHIDRASHPEIITNDYLTNVFVDITGCIWILEDFSGISRLSPKPATFRRSLVSNNPEVADKNNIRSISRIDKSTLFIGTQNGETYFFDENSRKLTFHKKKPYKVYRAYKDANGTLWTGTRGDGLYVGNRQYKKGDSGLPSNDVYDIEPAADGSLWIGFWYGGIAKTEGKGENLKFKHYLGQSNVHDLLSDNNKLLWIATEDGLYIFNPQHPEKPRHYSSNAGNFPFDAVLCLCMDSKGHIWTGTRGGGVVECQLKGDSIATTVYGKRQGLPSAEVNALVAAKDRIWIATDDGLCSIDIGTKDIRNYKTSPTPLEDVYNENAAVLLGNGMPLFGSHHGIVEVAAVNNDGGKAAATRITAVETGNDERILSPQGKVELRYDNNTVRICFSNFQYNHLGSTLYTCYMEGVDKDWGRPQSENHAVYRNLPPGEYVFHVRANDGYSHGGSEAAVTVRILQPWWNTPLAWLIYAAILTAIATYVALTLRKIYRLRGQLRIEKEMTAFKTEFLTHISEEFQNHLTLFKEDFSKGRRRLVSLTRMLAYFRQAVLKDITIAVEDDDIVAFVRKQCEQQRFSSTSGQLNVAFIPFQSQFTVPFDHEKMEIIINSLISYLSAATTTEKKNVEVRMHADEGRLHIAVTAENAVISEEKQKAMFKPFSADSISMFVSRQLATAHKGQLTYTPESGFLLSFPVDREAYSKEEFKKSINTLNQEETQETRETIAALMPPLNSDVTVAVIEDDTELRDLMKGRLSAYFTVETGESIGDAEVKNNAFNDKSDAFNDENHEDTAASKDNPVGYIIDIDGDASEKAKTVAAIRKHSHAPILVLSSDNDDSLQMRYIKAGVDGFFVKPCSLEVLSVRFIQLIRQYLATEKAVPAPDPAVAAPVAKVILSEKADKVFLEKFQLVLSQNAIEPDFSVETFAAKMGLGRTQFYNKVKKLTGKTPLEHIREARFHEAARLLVETNMTIDEIREKCGFMHPTYFYNNFKAHFGMSPAMYRKTR